MVARLLPPRSRQRTTLMTAGVVALLLIVTQFVLPGAGAGRGTPGAIVFFGSVLGLINALTAVGIILVYRSNRIINFAQTAIGASGSIFAYNLMTALNWPFPLAFVIGVILGAFLGAIVDIAIVKRFFNAPRLLLTSLTIALVGALIFLANVIVQFPIFGEADRTLAERLGQRQPNLPFDDFSFNIGGVPLDFGFGELFAIGACMVTLAAVAYFLYRTKVGVAVRAASENTERASLLGIPVKLMSTVVWTIAGVVSAVSLMCHGLVTDFTSSAGGGLTTLLNALAAAVLARMRSIPVAVVSSVGISIATQAIRWSYAERVELVDVGVLAIIVGGLLFQSRERARGEEGEGGSWQTVEEFRPVPKELAAIRGVRVSRWVLGLVVLGFVLLVPWILTVGGTNTAGRLVIFSIVLLSLVVLTGWAGLVSLGQMGLVAIGAVVGGALTFRLGVPFWVAVPTAALFTAIFAVVLGLSALRIRGIYLGIVTLAFAATVQGVLFQDEYFGWLLPERVDRPTAFFLNFEDERSMYYLCVAALLIAMFIVTALRRTRTGRVTIAMRENEANVQAFGVNLVRTRLAAFALSGFLAGFAGVVLAHHQKAIDPSSYNPLLSINFFVLAVVAGVGSVSGAIIAGVYLALQTLALQITGPVSIILAILFEGLGLLFLLYMFPRGLSALFYGLRDGVLRIIAQRRQIVVPSLFADYDPLAVERQLAPLSEPDFTSGLAKISPEFRYRKASVLYATRDDGGRRGAREEEIKALQAAAERAGEEG